MRVPTHAKITHTAASGSALNAPFNHDKKMYVIFVTPVCTEKYSSDNVTHHSRTFVHGQFNTRTLRTGLVKDRRGPSPRCVEAF